MQDKPITSAFLYVLLVNVFLLFEIHAWNNPEDNDLDVDSKFRKTFKSPASQLKDEVDIIKLLNVSTKAQGVSLTEGPITGFPAYKFRLPYTNVQLQNSAPVTGAMSDSGGFTTVFVFRQQKNTIGTLVSVNSPGRLSPWFQITSNLKTGEIVIRYRLNGLRKVYQFIVPYVGHHRKSWSLASWTWLSLSADFNSGVLRLEVDCQPSHLESLTNRQDKAKISVPKDSLVYFGQEPGRKKKFLGSVQVAKVLPYAIQHRLWDCYNIAENLPAEYRKPIM